MILIIKFCQDARETPRMSSEQAVLHREVETLYSAHHTWFGWLKRKLGCAHRAADLAHDTFLRLLARDEPLDAREPRAYLTTVAQRVLYNHWRLEQIEQAWLDAIAHVPEPLAPSPEERALILETLYEIDALLDGLPAPVKRAFLLAQLDGATHAQIAAELRISIATVKRHLMRTGEQCFFAMAGVELYSGEARDAERRAFEHWLAEHPDHAAAWTHIESVCGRIQGLSEHANAARAALSSGDVRKRRRALKTLALLLFAGSGAWVAEERAPWRAWKADLRTPPSATAAPSRSPTTPLSRSTPIAPSISATPQANAASGSCKARSW
ncbi:Sigma factor, ECF subfamily [Candidatus Burkholderia humilis]|nr:Sigma factor, ECF subfamily [Candidatus Burkholderia humilis]